MFTTFTPELGRVDEQLVVPDDQLFGASGELDPRINAEVVLLSITLSPRQWIIAEPAYPLLTEGKNLPVDEMVIPETKRMDRFGQTDRDPLLGGARLDDQRQQFVQSVVHVSTQLLQGRSTLYSGQLER